MTNHTTKEQRLREKGQHVWSVHADGVQSNDFVFFNKAFIAQAERWGLYEVVLKDSKDGNISLYQSVNQDAGMPHILIAAGFHGEEPAGCWGMLNFLRQGSPALFDNIAVSFLPAVNLSGLTLGQRLNKWGENPNRGFTVGTTEKPSQEGIVLLQHAELLKNAARDGVLCCHEDILRDRAYLYSLEHFSQPSRFTASLCDELSRSFPLVTEEQIDGCECKDGLIFNHYDSSFESWLFEMGANLAVCTETPALKPFVERVEANRLLMEAFVSAVLERNGIGAGM